MKRAANGQAVRDTCGNCGQGFAACDCPCINCGDRRHCCCAAEDPTTHISNCPWMPRRKQKPKPAPSEPAECVVNRLVTENLPLGVMVQWTVEPAGLQTPDVGDEVVAAVVFHLPMEGAGDLGIDKRLRFGGRLVLCGESLTPYWGEASGRRTRRRVVQCGGDTWRQAFDCAAAAARIHVGLLRDALQRREDALHSDGEEHVAAKNLLDSAGVAGPPAAEDKP